MITRYPERFMPHCLHPNRRMLLAQLTASGAMLLPGIAMAETETVILGGEVTSDGAPVRRISRQRFQLKAGPAGAVIRQRRQVFYLDPETEAEFSRDDASSTVVLAAGGLLSVLGPLAGGTTRIITPNAVGAIRGTTTYIAWQAKEQRSYACCCYGGVDLVNSRGGSQALRTDYHQAVILPESGGIEPAPYPAPLNHFDDDIAALEGLAGRQPRWQLPGGEMQFFAPRPLPLG